MTRDRVRDAGMAAVLLCLLVAYWGHRPWLLPLAIILLVATMAAPQVLRPLALVWFGVGRWMGEVISKGVLTIVFFLVVTPVGLIRRWAGRDPLQIRRWRENHGSVLSARQGVVRPEDLTDPY